MLRAADFDAVVIWKVDRLARRVLDFLHVDEMLRQRGAGLVAVEDPIDMTTPMGRAFATILAVFGEMEAAAIAARVKAARGHIVKAGRWPGGGYPYGYMPVDNPDGPGKVLVQDPDRIEWLRRMVLWAQNGLTVAGIATRLSQLGAPAPIKSAGHAYVWKRQSVRYLLRNPVLAGATPHNPGRPKSAAASDPLAVLRDEDGAPIIREDLAVISLAEFEDLLATLDARTATLGPRTPTSPFLARVARCDDCDVFLCRGSNQRRPTLYCPQCRQTIGRTALDAWITARLLDERGDEPCMGTTVREQWRLYGADEARRSVLVSQLDSLRIRRGVVGRYFDEQRILLAWRTPATEEQIHE